MKTWHVLLLCLGMAGVCAADSPSDPAPAPAASTVTPAQLRAINIDWRTDSANVSRATKVQLDPAVRKLQFSNMAVADFTPLREASVATGEGFTEGMAHSGLRPVAPEAASWYFVGDVSGTNKARQKVIAAELKTVLDAMEEVPASDSVFVYALSADIEKWGSATNDSEKAELKSLIQKRIDKKQYGDVNSFRTSSLIYSGLRRIISLGTQVGDDVPKRLIVLLSDGNDETGGNALSAAGEREAAKAQLVSEATAAKVPIHTLAFAQNSEDRGGFPQLQDLSAKTKGLYCAAALNTFVFADAAPAKRINIHTHPSTYSLDVQLPAGLGHDVRVTLKGATAEGAITVRKDLVAAASVIEQPTPPPAPVATEEETTLRALLEQLDPLHAKLDELKQKEGATPPAHAAELLALTTEIKRQADECVKTANGLKKKDHARIRDAVGKLRVEEGLSEDKKAWADKIAGLCEQSAAIEQKDVLTLLGRTTPLPAPEGEQPEGEQPEGEQPPGVPTSTIIISAALGLLLVIIGICFFLRKGKKVQEDPWEDNPLRPQVPVPSTGGKVPPSPVLPLYCELFSVKDHQSWQIHQSTVVIGRAATCDVVISNTSVSSSHCILKLTRDGLWTLTDLGSANGIYSNGSTQTFIDLHDGSEFELGDVLLRFHDCR